MIGHGGLAGQDRDPAALDPDHERSTIPFDLMNAFVAGRHVGAEPVHDCMISPRARLAFYRMRGYVPQDEGLCPPKTKTVAQGFAASEDPQLPECVAPHFA